MTVSTYHFQFDGREIGLIVLHRFSLVCCLSVVSNSEIVPLPYRSTTLPFTTSKSSQSIDSYNSWMLDDMTSKVPVRGVR